MTTYSTPFKSGTFDGAPTSGATTFAVAGFTPAAGDVGRLVVITSGNARLQHREIVAVSGQNLTVAHAWDSNPFIDPTADGRASDVLPGDGDSFALTYDARELAATDSDITLVNENQMRLTGTLRVSGSAYIHFKGLHVEFDSATVEVSGTNNGGGLIFGYYKYVAGQDGYFTGVCNLFDRTNEGTGGDQMASGNGTATAFGLLDIYGGTLRVKSSCFWRCYRDSANASQMQVRWIGLNIDGPFGSRLDGPRSMIVVSNVNSNSVFGIANPRSAVARVELTSLNSLQAGYVFLTQGPAGRAVFNRLADINTRLLRVSGTGGGGEVYEVIGKKAEIDPIPAIAIVEGGGTSSHTLRYGNLVQPVYVGASGLAISQNIKTRLYDTGNNLITENTISNSAYPQEFVRHTDWATSGGTKTFANGTLYAPYTLRQISYGKQFAVTNINAEDTFTDAIVLLDDPTITQSSKSIVDGYTEIDTPEKFYDRSVAWLQDNITDETGFLIGRSGDVINAGSYNVTIDATAASAFAVSGSTITIKASTYTGDMITTGIITLVNGAEFVGTRTDANGTIDPPKTASITGITAGSRLQIYNVTTGTETVNQIVAGTSYTATYAEGAGYTTGDVVRVRLAYDSGVTAKLPFGGQVVVGASGWALLATQQDDAVYNSFGIDGSAVTEFVADFPNIQVDINDPDGSTCLDRLYAWFVHIQSSEEGIRNWFNGIVPEDEANFRVVTATLDLKIDNIAATGVIFTGNLRLYRDDGTAPVVASTSGGGSITLYAGKVYTIETGISGLTPAESVQLFNLNTNNLDVAVSTRATSADIPTAIQIADTVLRRSTANVEASGTGDAISLKSLYGMVAQGVHNTQVSGPTLTVTRSDDATVLGTRTVTTDPSAEPIVGIDSD